MRVEMRKWPLQSIDTRRKIGLAIGAKPWTSQKSLVGVPGGARVRDVIDCCFWKLRAAAKNKGKRTDDIVRDHWVNISQSVDRLPVAGPQSWQILFLL